MDASEPRATKKRALSLSAAGATRTPSPSRRRRRRLLTGSSPGCVPRVTGVFASSSSSSSSASGSAPSSAATTPSRGALRTPPPRRLLPPTAASASGRLASASATGMAPPPRVPRSAATSVLRLDDDDALDDDSFSVISGDGSPERDRHVLDLLGFNSLADGTQTFTLFTPSPAASKVSVTRTVKAELTTGLLTPLASPARSIGGSKKDLSPSHFFRSPYAKSRSNSAVSSPASLRLSAEGDENELEPEPRHSLTRSPHTPKRGQVVDAAIKDEPMPATIACKLPDGARSSSSIPTSSIPWRRNSLSLMRTPSPAASRRAKARRARAQIFRSTGKDPFGDDMDDPSCAPSALQGTNDQDWLFSFANTLSPLAPGAVNDDDLETSFLSLRFSPAVPSSFDLQRLLPPFPSPGLGPQDHPEHCTPTPKTPVQTTQNNASSSSSSSRGSLPSSSTSTSSIDLSDSFPNIRASTSATPGRDERLKVSSSSVMKMKLHVTFDDFPLSHTKREIEAINNSLKRKKQSRKRKLDESKQRQMKTNSKGLNVQRKLLQTPTKEDPSSEAKAEAKEEKEKAKPKHVKTVSGVQSLTGRKAQRKLLDSVEEADEISQKPGTDLVEETAQSGVASCAKAAASDPEISKNSLHRRLSPTLGSVSTPTLPTSLASFVKTPNLHPLKLRKSPTAAKATAPSAAPVVETATPKAPTNPTPVPTPAAPVKAVVTLKADPPQQEPTLSVHGQTSASAVPITTPAKALAAPKLKTPIATPLPVGTGGFASSAKLLITPVQQPAAVNTSVASQAPTGNPAKKVHCNCKKSKCLKLYCECFANGEYCDELCNCVSCCNSPAHESVRQQAITSRLEKNPNAFKPKIELTVVTMTPGGTTPARMIPGFTTPLNDHRHGHHPHLVHGKGDLSGDLKKMHKHGCHCKKSGCQKRYCECFQAGVPCGENCRCIDCKNHSPYVVKNGGVATPLSAITTSGPGARELVRGSIPLAAAAATPDANGDQFVSPSLPSVRQRLRIDRETWARNFSSPFEVSPRRERERTERFRAQLKNSRASALLRSFNGASSGMTQPAGIEVQVKTEPGVAAQTPSALSFRVSTTPSFTSPPVQSVTLAGPKPPRSLSPLSDATRPPPAPTPFGKDARSRHTKRFMPYNPHALEALSISRKTPGRVYVFPLFGNDLPPVKMEVSAKIFHFLTNADVYNASLVNRLWSRVTMGDTVWDHHNFRRLPQHLLTASDVTHHSDDGDVEMQQA